MCQFSISASNLPCATSEQTTVAGVTRPTTIKYGDLDGGNHPYVGLMVAQTASGQPLWRCSGTLMSPNGFLAAEHCTEYTHPLYNPSAFYLHDLGVVLLDAPVAMPSYRALP